LFWLPLIFLYLCEFSQIFLDLGGGGSLFFFSFGLGLNPLLNDLKNLFIPPKLVMGSFSQDKWPKLSFIPHIFAGPF
jgi:hypothetical protein